jgi:hypothetical protein
VLDSSFAAASRGGVSTSREEGGKKGKGGGKGKKGAEVAAAVEEANAADGPGDRAEIERAEAADGSGGLVRRRAVEVQVCAKGWL